MKSGDAFQSVQPFVTNEGYKQAKGNIFVQKKSSPTKVFINKYMMKSNSLHILNMDQLLDKKQ
jgi:hypothetical protein